MEENQATQQPELKEPDPSVLILRENLRETLLYAVNNCNIHLALVEYMVKELFDEIKTKNEVDLERDKKVYSAALDEYHEKLRKQQGGNA